MMDERQFVVSFVIRRRELVVAAAAALVALRPSALSTETLTMTTYYPSPYGVYLKLNTTEDARLAYNGGSVGIGTKTPAANAKLHVAGASEVSRFDGRVGIGGDPAGGAKLHVSGEGDISRFDGRVGLNGPFWGGYGGAVTVMRNDATNTGNVYVQGNENDDMLRLGDAWGMNGIYSEGGDLVLGSRSGKVFIGQDGYSHYLAHMCKIVVYSVGSTTACQSGWSVMSALNSGQMPAGMTTQFYNGGEPVLLYANSLGDIRAFRRAVAAPNLVTSAYISTLPSSGQMLCCKLETY